MAPRKLATARGDRIARRALLALPACWLTPRRVLARSDVARLGVLAVGAAPAPGQPDALVDELLRGLAERGYVQGRNLQVDIRHGEGPAEVMDKLAVALVAAGPDVIVTGGQPAREAVRKATRSIPVVQISGSNVVREGWAKSFARPGGNVTGLTVTFPELMPKNLELLKEALPAVERVAVMIDPQDVVDAADVLHEIGAGAARLGLQMQVLDMHGPDRFEAALLQARQHKAQALFAMAIPPPRYARLSALALRDRLPLFGDYPAMARAGFLMGYGADLADLFHRAAGYVDRILKGALPAEMPIERPTKFRLAVNLGTAKALGIALPQSLIVRADEVIE